MLSKYLTMAVSKHCGVTQDLLAPGCRFGLSAYRNARKSANSKSSRKIRTLRNGLWPILDGVSIRGLAGLSPLVTKTLRKSHRVCGLVGAVVGARKFGNLSTKSDQAQYSAWA